MNLRINSILARLSQLTVGRSAVFTFLIALIIRIKMFGFYSPVLYSDSFSYRRIANQILRSWWNYDGSRVPGYPLFLALMGSDQRVYLTQLGLGILITMGFFYIAWRVSGKTWFAGIAALIHQLNLGQLLFEANILTETLATFFLVLTFAGVIHGIYVPKARKPWLAFVVGLSSALAILTRPLFVLLPFLLFFVIVFFWQDGTIAGISKDRKFVWLAHGMKLGWQSIKKQWLNLSILILSVGVLILGWMTFIWVHYHQWALSTMTGYHLVQHTGEFFEYVPDKYAEIRDTYIQYRDQRVSQFGTQANTIWEAIPAMQKASGLSFYDLSRVLSKISIDLISKHPDLYMQNVIQGWMMFWKAPVYWSPDALRIVGLSQLMEFLILIQRFCLVSVNLFFILSPALIWFQRKVGLSKVVEIRIHTQRSWFLLLSAVWITSFVQTILDHGDNPRFLVPMQTIIVLWFVWWLYKYLNPWLITLGIKKRSIN